MNGYDQLIQQQFRRILMKRFARQVGVVASGVHVFREWSREESPFRNLFVEVHLGAMEEEAARRLITAPVRGIYDYDAEAVDLILRREGDSYAVGNAFFARWLRERADWDAKAEVSAEGTLAVYTQSELEPVRENRLALADMERMLDAIRRALVAWQREGVPGTERLAAALEKPGGPRHKLEATLPLLPPVLAYKVEWGGEVRDLLEELLRLLRRMARGDSP